MCSSWARRRARYSRMANRAGWRWWIGTRVRSNRRVINWLGSHMLSLSLSLSLSSSSEGSSGFNSGKGTESGQITFQIEA